MKKPLLVLLMLGCFCASVQAQTKNERLYKAVATGDTTQAKHLLQERADPNFVMAAGPWMKANSLIAAVNRKDLSMVKLLLANKADVNWKDGFNTSALMYAAAMGNKEIVMLLLANGANIKDADGQGNTVLSAARESKNAELIKLVEEKNR